MLKMTKENPAEQSGFLACELFFCSRSGQKMLSEQQARLDKTLPELFGFNLLQLSADETPMNTETSNINNHFCLHQKPYDHAQAFFENSALPIETQSIDTVLLHHYLDYCQHPHDLLKEVNRVTIPYGQLIIFGFNPLSFLGAKTAIAKGVGKGLKPHQLFTLSKLIDWLKLIDFKVLETEFGCYTPPWPWLQKRPFTEKLEAQLHKHQWPLGGYYYLRAVKQVTPVTPRPLKKRHRPSFIPVMKPSLNSSIHKDNKE
jgi:SAM-dependent methyltransferase